MSKKVLVTGGAGFIGSHLCGKLLSEGNKVICLDNMFTGTYNNILQFMDNPNFEFINDTVINPINIDGINEIYNFACPASPVHYQYDPIMTTKTNFLGALNVLELAKKCGARVLQASTSEIYGDPEIHPQVESYRGNVNTIGPRACYDEGKRIAETLFSDFRRQYSVDTCIIRIFNTYGPNMLENDGRVVSNFIVQALRDNDITVYGDGKQTRSFCYVEDMVDAITKVMAKKNFSGPINLGNPQEISVVDLANLIIKMTNSASKIIYMPLPQDDPIKRKPNIDLAINTIDWKPSTKLEFGIGKTINYFEKQCR